MQVIEVLPTGNTFCVNGVVQTIKLTPTLSVAVPSLTEGGLQTMTPESAPVVVLPIYAAGQATKGGCTSCNVTVNEQVATLPAVSEALHITVVSPYGNTDPEGGTQPWVATPILSVAEKLHVIVLLLLPELSWSENELEHDSTGD